MNPNNTFSGWSVLGGCFIIMFFVQGGIQSFAVFLPSIIRDTGFSLGAVAMISTIATVGAFAANLCITPLLKRMSAKWILLIGTIVCAIHFVILSESSSLLGLYFGAACAGISIGFGTVAPVSVVVTNWFVVNRATYMSIVIAGSMFGGAVLMPMSGQLIHYFGWRTAYHILALLVGCIGILTVLFVITDAPHKKGQKAYSAGETYAPTETGSESAGVTAVQARASLSYWLLLAGILLIGCSTNIENFLPAFWQSRGVSVGTSSNIMGVYALLTGICTMMLGRITDRLGSKTYALLTCGLFILGLIGIYIVGAGAMPLMTLALLPFAAGAKKTSTLTPPLVVAESFGRAHYSTIIGSFTATLQLGIAMSNPIIGALHRISGDYQLPFMVMAGLNGVAFVLVFTALHRAPFRPGQASVPAESSRLHYKAGPVQTTKEAHS